MPVFGDAAYYYGDAAGFVAWDGTRIFRTNDILAASPVWALINTGISGNIYDCRMVIADDGALVAWLMTSTAIFVCADLRAETPGWTSKLAIATVQGADAVPAAGTVNFRSMAVDPNNADFCIVATGPTAHDSNLSAYAHAYFWVTDDGGDNWTQVDMNGFLVGTRGYCHADVYGMQIFPGSPSTIYCVRSVPLFGLNRSVRVFVSTNGGTSWAQGASLDAASNNTRDFSLMLPHVESLTRSYAREGGLGTSARPDVHTSDDGWLTQEREAKPSGYGGLGTVWNVAGFYGEPLHLLGWFHHTSEAQMHLLESEDGGETWSLVYDSGAADANIPNTPLGTIANAARWNVPIAWPADPNLWVMVRGAAESGNATTLAVQLTGDYFASLDDKTGNLAALLTTWTAGLAGGFFIPHEPVGWTEYAVGDGHDLAAHELTALTPQPSSVGVKVTRRPHSVSGGLQDEALYLEVVYSALGSVAEYQAVLTAFGVLNAIENQITITARSQTLTWERWNGTAVRPQQGSDVRYERYFPRQVVILVKDLEVAS